MGVRRTIGGLGLRLGAAVVRRVRRAARTPLGAVAPAEVLACSPLRIGDAVQMAPALLALRAAWPDARLTLALRPLVAPLGEAFAGVDAVIAFRGPSELRAALPARPDVAVSFGLRFDAAWTLRRVGARRSLGYDDSGRGMLLSDPVPAPGWVNRPVWAYPTLAPVPQARFWLDLLRAGGIAAEASPTPQLRVPAAAAAEADALVREAGLADRPLVLCHAGADPSYRWPTDRWVELVRALQARGHTAVLGGAPADRPLVAAIAAGAGPATVDLAGRTTLPGYLALCARAAAVVSVDTGAAHLAAAVGTPTVVLFGAGDPRIWGPTGPSHAVLQGVNPDCYGCKRPRCYRARHFCMEAVSVDDVVGAVDAVGGRPGA